MKAKTHVYYIGSEPEPSDRRLVEVGVRDTAKIEALTLRDGNFEGRKKRRATVRDLRTKHMVTLRNADCGMDCWCALAIVKEEQL